MSDYNYLQASNGSGDVPLIHLTANRAVGATVFNVDTVTNVPTNFLATCGTLLPSGFIDTTTKTDFKGHVSGATLVIDSFEPGTTDAGNTSTQVIVIKPTTGWANRVANFLMNMTNKGTPEAVTVDALTANNLLTANNGLTVTGPVTVPQNSITQRAIINPYKFSVYRGQTGAFADGTWGTVDNLSVWLDSNNNINASTGVWTCPVTGFYFVVATSGTTNAAGNLMGTTLRVLANGNNVIIGGEDEFDNDVTYDIMHCSISGMVHLNAGDTCVAQGMMHIRGGSVGFANVRWSGFLVSQT